MVVVHLHGGFFLHILLRIVYHKNVLTQWNKLVILNPS